MTILRTIQVPEAVAAALEARAADQGVSVAVLLARWVGTKDVSHDDARLDEALEESFPASDSPAV